MQNKRFELVEVKVRRIDPRINSQVSCEDLALEDMNKIIKTNQRVIGVESEHIKRIEDTYVYTLRFFVENT